MLWRDKGGVVDLVVRAILVGRRARGISAVHHGSIVNRGLMMNILSGKIHIAIYCTYHHARIPLVLFSTYSQHYFLNLLDPLDGPALDSREIGACICFIMAALALSFQEEVVFFLICGLFFSMSRDEVV